MSVQRRFSGPDPVLGDGPFVVESAVPAHRNLRVVVMAKFQQPWSIAFLPDGNIFVTERPGRLRIIRNGVLDPNPVPGGPRVHAQGLQGLMDVVLHPRFAENKWVYIAYHKPVPNPDAPPTASGAPAMAGATTLMRGTWNGSALVDVKDIFESGATRTESSRIGFGRDGMLYMSISASGTGPDVFRSADPNDYAGKTVRLRDDGTIPPDNPFVNKPGYKPAIYTLGHRNGHSMALNPETGRVLGHRAGPQWRGRGQCPQGWCELRLAVREPRAELHGTKDLGEPMAAGFRSADRRLGAVDRRGRGNVLYR